MKYLLIILFFIISLKAQSLEITLSQGTVKPTPIAVTNLFSNNSTLDKLGKNIASVISDNLQRSGLFIPINQKAFIQSSESLSDQPRFEDWKILKTQHLFHRNYYPQRLYNNYSTSYLKILNELLL